MARSASHRSIRIAATGFGPFHGVPFNASVALVAYLENEARNMPAVELATTILPVDWTAAFQESRRLIEAAKPHAILHFGVSTRVNGFEIERRAVNRAIGNDEAGARPPAEHLRSGAPTELPATLPAGPLALALSLDGVPATVSDDAGQYLCNAVLYETLFHCASLSNPPLAGFIHMPVVLKETVAAIPPDAQWQTLLKGASLILRFTAQHRTQQVNIA